MSTPSFRPGWFRIPSPPGRVIRWCEIDTTSPGRANWIAAYPTREAAGDPSRADFLLPLEGFLRLNPTRIETEDAR